MLMQLFGVIATPVYCLSVKKSNLDLFYLLWDNNVKKKA